MNSSDGVGVAQSPSILLFDIGKFPSSWWYIGCSYSQPSERLETFVACVKHSGADVYFVLLVIIVVLQCFISVSLMNEKTYNFILYLPN